MLPILNSSFEMTKNWLLNSGIFVSEQSDQNFGGVHSFYDEKNKQFAFCILKLLDTMQVQ